MWQNVHLDTNGPFPVLSKTFGPWFWIDAAYSYILIIVSELLLVLSLRRKSALYREQSLALFIGARMKVLLVDDHSIFMAGLQSLLVARGIEVAGTAQDGLEALEKARLLQPDVILMDIVMPHCSGLEAIRSIKAEMPEVKIVMLTAFDDDKNLFEAIKRGASGYLLKNLIAEDLFTMLEALERGEAPLSPGLAARLMEELARQAAKKNGCRHRRGKLSAKEVKL